MSQSPKNRSDQPAIRLSPKSEVQDTHVQVDSYRLAHVETATPERLLVMLYDSALKYLNLAVPAILQKDLDAVHRNILKVEAIILELMSVLDMEVGGEMARNLYELYDYIYRQLVQANLTQDAEIIKEVIVLLQPLRSAWAEASETVAQLRAEGKFGESGPGNRHFAG